MEAGSLKLAKDALNNRSPLKTTNRPKIYIAACDVGHPLNHRHGNVRECIVKQQLIEFALVEWRAQIAGKSGVGCIRHPL